MIDKLRITGTSLRGAISSRRRERTGGHRAREPCSPRTARSAGASRIPWRPKPPHHPAQGQIRHLAFHGGRAEPRRSVRPQAASSPNSTASRCRIRSASRITAMGTADNTLMASHAHVEAVRAKRALGLRLVSRTSPSTSMTWPSSAPAGPTDSITSGSVCQMNTGDILAGRPSMGAWVTYGLGSANQNLPTFVVLARR